MSNTVCVEVRYGGTVCELHVDPALQVSEVQDHQDLRKQFKLNSGLDLDEELVAHAIYYPSGASNWATAKIDCSNRPTILSILDRYFSSILHSTRFSIYL